MGLTNMLVMFMGAMKNLFVDMLDKGVVVFLDIKPMYSTIVKEHFELLEKVFVWLYKHTFYCKLKNHSFL